MNNELLENIFNKQEFVKVKVKDKKGKVITKTIRNNIFRPVDNFKEYSKRWDRVHKFVKVKIVHTALKILDVLIGKYVLQGIDDIPKENCNNLIRISYHSYMKGIEETFKRIIYDPNIKNKLGYYKNKITRNDSWLTWSKDNPHCRARVLLLQLWLTEVLEDTFDRGVMDIAMLESYHQIHKLYDGKVPTVEEYRMYDSGEARDIKYFVDTINVPVWDKEEKKK